MKVLGNVLTTYRRTPCRCRNCYKRKTLARHPDHYKIVPACPRCGNRTWYADYARMRDPEKSSGGKICKLDCMAPLYGRSFTHKTNTKGCRGYENHVLERSCDPKSMLGRTDHPEPDF